MYSVKNDPWACLIEQIFKRSHNRQRTIIITTRDHKILEIEIRKRANPLHTEGTRQGGRRQILSKFGTSLASTETKVRIFSCP